MKIKLILIIIGLRVVEIMLSIFVSFLIFFFRCFLN